MNRGDGIKICPQHNRWIHFQDKRRNCPECGLCWLCLGQNWIPNGDIEDGMMTGRDPCPMGDHA